LFLWKVCINETWFPFMLRMCWSAPIQLHCFSCEIKQDY
jgi:hypothetical protein